MTAVTLPDILAAIEQAQAARPRPYNALLSYEIQEELNRRAAAEQRPYIGEKRTRRLIREAISRGDLIAVTIPIPRMGGALGTAAVPAYALNPERDSDMTKLILESEPEPDLRAVVAGYNGDIAQLQSAVRRAKAQGRTLRQVAATAAEAGAPPGLVGLIRAIYKEEAA
jgi:hypothetical protein